jgi:hypothetical protein
MSELHKERHDLKNDLVLGMETRQAHVRSLHRHELIRIQCVCVCVCACACACMCVRVRVRVRVCVYLYNCIHIV